MTRNDEQKETNLPKEEQGVSSLEEVAEGLLEEKAEAIASDQPELSKWEQRQLEFEQRKQEREAEKAQETADEEEAATESDSGDEPNTDDTAVSPSSEDDQGEAEQSVQDEEKVVEPVVKPSATKPRRPKRKANLTLQTAMPLILFSLIVMLLSAFAISPYSKNKVFEVTGTSNTDYGSVLKASKIKDSDYISQIFMNTATYEKAIVANDLWVKGARLRYEFPNRFIIDVDEFPIVAYQETVEGFHPILESGDRGEMVLTSQLPERFMRIELVDAKDIKLFIGQLMTVDKTIRESIDHVALAGSESTKDLLLLTMSDGNRIRVPLSEVALKLPYYKAIRTRLIEPSIIDMEVGIYATTEYLELHASETRASKEKEAKELEALNGTATTTAGSTDALTQTESGSEAPAEEATTTSTTAN